MLKSSVVIFDDNTKHTSEIEQYLKARDYSVLVVKINNISWQQISELSPDVIAVNPHDLSKQYSDSLKEVIHAIHAPVVYFADNFDFQKSIYELKPTGFISLPVHPGFPEVVIENARLLWDSNSQSTGGIKTEKMRNGKEHYVKFDSLYHSMLESACLLQIIYDENNHVVDTIILDVNHTFETELSVTKEQVVGRLTSKIYGKEWDKYLDIYANVVQTGTPKQFEAFFPADDRYFNISAFSPGNDLCIVFFQDITEEKRKNKLLAIQLELAQSNQFDSVHEFLQYFLGYAQELTNSNIGFYHLLEAGAEFQELKVWSVQTKKWMEQANITEYPALGKGSWRECVQYMQPVICNSSPTENSHSRDCSDILQRELVIPVIQGDRIVAVFGVANKEWDYNALDITILEQLAGFSYDIISRIHAEIALRNSENKYHDLFENMTEALVLHQVVLDESDNVIDLIYLDVNAAYEKLINADKSKLIGKRLTQISPSTEKHWFEFFSKVFKTQKSSEIVEYSRNLEKYLELKAFTPNKDMIMASLLDVTERHLSREALENRLVLLTRPVDDLIDVNFESLFNIDKIQKLQDEFADATGVASIISNPDGVPITKPSNFCELCGSIVRQTEKGRENCYLSDSMISEPVEDGPSIASCHSAGLWHAGAAIVVSGKHIANWLIGQVRDDTQTEQDIAKYAREIGIEEKQMIDAFNKVPVMPYKQFKRVADALYTLTNQLSSVAFQNIQQARYISDLKRAEEALRHNEAKQKAMISNISDVICIMNIEGVFEYLSPNIENLFGWKPIDLIGNSIWVTTHEDDEEFIKNDMKRLLKDPQGVASVETSFKCKNGEYKKVSLTAKNMTGNSDVGGVLLNFHDITERKFAEDEIVKSRSLLKATLDSTADGILSVSADGKWSIFNQKFVDMWNIPPDINEFVIDDVILEYVMDRVEEPEEFVKKVRHIYSDPKCITLDIIQLKNGRVFERYSQPQLLDDKVVGRVWSFRDVTEKFKAEEQKQKALEEKEVMLKEIHHRVKNNLQVIISLLNLQKAKIKDAETIDIFQDISKRIYSIALVHEQLYKSKDLAEINMKIYIMTILEDLKNTFAQDKSIHIDYNAIDVMFDINTAIPCGLLLSELISNAFKHAFKGRQAGRLLVTLELKQDDIYELMVKDDGTGLTNDFDINKLDSLGLKLVRALTIQLSGDLVIEQNMGTAFIVTFKRQTL